MPDDEEIPYEQGAEQGEPVTRESMPKARTEDVAREDDVKGEGEVARNPAHHEAEIEGEEPSSHDELTE